jgi:hypothetical protein
MKAFLINAENQVIEAVEISSMDDIVTMIGYATIESDVVGNNGDRLFFDEECFLRGSKGKFQIDTVIPVSGKGVLIGASEDGTTLSDVSTELDELQGRIKYL